MYRRTDLDSCPGLLSIIIPATVAIMMPFLSPVVVGGLVDTGGWTEKDAGLLVSTEMGVLAWSGLAGLLWLNRMSWKLVSVLAISLMLVGNLASVFFYQSGEALLISRTIAGAGAGTLTALAYGSLARSAKPHRNYGLYSMSQMSMAMLFLAVLPVLIAGEGTGKTGFISSLLVWLGVPIAVGMKAFYVIMVGLSSLALLLSLGWFPLRPPAPAVTITTRSPALFWIFPGIMLIAILMLMMSQQAFWTYSERIGTAAGLNRSSIGTVLALGAFAGLLGASTATLIGNSLARPATIMIIFCIHIASLCCFLFTLNIYLFALGIFLHKFSWNFTIPYQLGMLAEVEKSGKAAVLSTVVTSFGISAGAGFAAFVVGDFGYRGVILGAMGFAVTYTLLMLLMHFQLSGARPAAYTSSPAR
jgi:predicted MFS family arabinose efflux permease